MYGEYYKLCTRGSPSFHLYSPSPPKKITFDYTPIFLLLFYLSVLNCFIFVLVLRVFIFVCSL